MDTHNFNKAYIDLTGRFPHRSSRGNEYILVGYHRDSNAIFSTALKRRTLPEVTRGWKIINDKIAAAQVEPSIYTIDNEANILLKSTMTKRVLNYQLVSPYYHRVNATEKAIQTFKNQFKAGLSSTDPGFLFRSEIDY